MTEVMSIQKVIGYRSKVKVTEVITQLSRFQFEFTYDDEMMDKAWCCLWEVPYCFSRSSVKFQGHTAKQKSSILTQIGCFRTVTAVWIHQWLRNDEQSLEYHRRGALLFVNVISLISRSHGTMNRRFDLNWAFPDSNFSFYSPMAMKWYTKLEAT